MILVVSFPEDEHTQAVIEALRRLGRRVALLDLADFPARRSVTLSWDDEGAPTHRIDGGEEPIDLRDVRVCWWRRVRSFVASPSVRRPDEQAFVLSETAQAVYGLLDTLPCAWMNPHAADEAAHRKPLQWTVAKAVGLSVASTLVTSNPDAARAFLAGRNGPTVFKAFIACLEAWRETRLVEPSDLDRLDSVRLAPVIFQDYVPGVDLRVTIIGRRVFAAEIDARGTSYPFDMRMVVGEAAMRPVTLPTAVELGLLALMERLGIVFGAVDMRRTDEGEHVFLEVNPAGQWLFVENRTGLPITQGVASHLAALDRAEP